MIPSSERPTASPHLHKHTGKVTPRRAASGRSRVEVVVAVTEGKLGFGTWGQILYGEFDGPRRKRLLVKIMGE